jgi:hypothetical protein
MSPAASGRNVVLPKYLVVLVPSGLSKTVDRSVRRLGTSRDPATIPAAGLSAATVAAAGATAFVTAAAFGGGGAGRDV